MRLVIALVATVVMNLAIVGTAAAADTKVAVVDMERALFLSDAAKSAVKEFEKANKDDIAKLKSLQESLMASKKKLDEEGDIISEEQRRQMANDMEQKTQEYQFYGRKLKQAEDLWKRGLLEKQLPQLEKMLKEIIEKEGYDLVFNAQAAVFTSPKADITKLLIDRLNKQK
ncbi:MAG: OmpH family outer membrane protein [Oleibacter sp.]|nr:OmpH family outer membrane protein [Thalassolituus sp.]